MSYYDNVFLGAPDEPTKDPFDAAYDEKEAELENLLNENGWSDLLVSIQGSNAWIDAISKKAEVLIGRDL